MSISFSGLASGLDTTSWVESLVALKRAKVTTLQEEKEELLVSKDTLSSIKNFFNSFRSTIERITDSRFNIVSMDLFAQNIATSANLSVLTATASSEAEEGSYKVKVDKLASNTTATSNYKKTTTTTVTATATEDTLLTNIGVKTGNIGVTVNGIKHGIAITEKDTIGTFIDKLENIGVEASFNKNTGVFSMNISAGDIDDDIDNDGNNDTEIVEKLHLAGVNEGYKTQNKLEVEKVETVWKEASASTKLIDLGVKAGTITIEANDSLYDVTINDETTIEQFVQALNTNHINATYDETTGIFTLNDAEITNEGDTEIIRAFGLQSTVYSKSQVSGNLSLETVVTTTTSANSATFLKDLGDGISITDGDTVVVKNSNNKYTTITVGEATTIGGLLAEISNAGLYAAINNDGTVEISGGVIEGGSFDAVNALGLSTKPFTAMVTGSSLTETTIEYKIVDLQTRLVEDLGVTRGYLEVTDADGNKFYEKIYSGQTIADFMADMGNLGIYTKLDEETGVLEITGGAFRTLDNLSDEVGSLITNGTIVENDDTYKQGTNLLECLYGSDVISTDQISVSSTYSRTRALTTSVSNLQNADLTTTLELLGLTTEGTAIFDSHGSEITIDITKDMTIQALREKLSDNGISTEWDAVNSKLTINNATLVGGTSDLGYILNLTEVISGKYVNSDAIYTTTYQTIFAEPSTPLTELGLKIDNNMVYTSYTIDGTIDASGVSGTVIGIGSATDLQNLANLVNTGNTMSGKTFVLTNDIDMSSIENFAGIGESESKSFQGTFDGQGYTISNLKMSETITASGTKGFVGLFAVASNATFKNVTISNANISLQNNYGSPATSSGRVGTLVGHGWGNTYDGITIENTNINITGGNTSVGGLCGTAYGCDTIKNCSTTGTISGAGTEAGGIVGWVYTHASAPTIIDSCQNAINIASNLAAGGIVGYIDMAGNATISNCYNKGSISSNGTYSAGIIGCVMNTESNPCVINVRDCYNSGEISGYSLTSNTLNFGIFRSNGSTLSSVNITNCFGASTDITGTTYTTKTHGSYTTQWSSISISTTGCENDLTPEQVCEKAVTAGWDTNKWALSPTNINLKMASEEVILHKEDGTTYTLNVDSTTTLQDLVDQINYYGVTASISGGKFQIENGYITNEALENALGLETKITGESVVLGTQLTHTITEGATGESTLGEIIETLGATAESKVAGGYNLSFKGTTLTVDENTTLNNLFEQISNAGGRAFLDSTGRIHIEGGTLTGSVAEALGFTTQNITTAVSASGETITMTATVVADETTTFEELGVINNPLLEQTSHLTKEQAESLGYTWVTNREELEEALASKTNIMLGCDIDLAGDVWVAQTTEFEGVFDGNNYKIKNMTSSTGLFNTIANGASVINLKFDNATITSNQNCGVIASSAEGDINLIQNCHITNSNIIANSIYSAGCFVGNNTGTLYIEISTIYNTNIEGADAGGFVGKNSGTLSIDSSTILESKVTGQNSGGFVGFENSGCELSITNCLTNTLIAGNLRGVFVGRASSGTLITDNAYNYQQPTDLVGVGSFTDANNIKLNTIPTFDDVISIYDNTNKLIRSEFIDRTATIDDFFTILADYGITGSISDGIISLNSSNGNYIKGGLAEALGITTTSTTETTTIGMTNTSSVAVTYTQTIFADETSRVGDFTNLYNIDGEITVDGVTGTIIGISTAEELALLATHVNNGSSMAGKTFVLTDDIDLSDYENWTPIGNSDYNNCWFTGTFDGNGHTISNLNQEAHQDRNVTNNNYIGLFGVAVNATIKNLKLDNVNIEDNDIANYIYAGALLGIGSNITLENIEVNNLNMQLTSSNGYMGGVAGRILNDSHFNNIKADGTIVQTGSAGAVGGLFGELYLISDAVQYCYSSVDITANSSYAGGIAAGLSTNNTIAAQYCLNNGTIHNNNWNTGGIFGLLNINTSNTTTTNVEDCYNLGSLSSADNTAVADVLTRCNMTTGIINVKNCGGLYGEAYKATNGTTINVTGFVTNYSDIMSTTSSAPEHWDVSSGVPIPSVADIYIRNTSGNIIGRIENVEDMTFEELFNNLDSYGINASFDNGIISLTSANGNYITGGIAEALGIEVVETTETLTGGKTFQSTVAVTFTETSVVDTTTTLEDLKHMSEAQAVAQGYTWVTNRTDLWNALNTSNENTKIMLGCDIDLAGEEWAYISIFTGEINGNNYTIRNLTQTNVQYGGLIGQTRNSTVIIKNLNIDEANITSTSYCGAIIGSCNGTANIENCTVTNSSILTNSSNAGGLIGNTSSHSTVLINNTSVSNNSITAKSSGGLIGLNRSKYTVINNSKIYSNNLVCSDSSGGILGNSADYSSVSAKNTEIYIDCEVNGLIGGSVSSITLENVTYQDEYGVGALYGSIITGGTVTETNVVAGEIDPNSDIYNLLEIYNSNNELIATHKLDNSSNVGDVFSTLAGYGISGSINNGVITLDSTNGNYIKGNVAERLGIGTEEVIVTKTVGTTATSTASILYTEEVVADYNSKVSEYINRYEIDGTIDASGVTGNVIGISTAEELALLATHVNNGSSMAGKTFVLTDDIDLSGYENWTPIGNDSAYALFKGTFDGQGYTISNLTQTQLASDSADNGFGGLFGVANQATIKNLKLDNVHIEDTDDSNSWYHVGALLSYGRGITIENIEVTNLYMNINATDEYGNLGGVVGVAKETTDNTLQSTINNVKASGTINHTGTIKHIGGIAGMIGTDDPLMYLYSMVNISAEDAGFTGGLIGGLHSYNTTVAQFCANQGNISSNIAAGGLLGVLSISSSEATIANCYSTGNVNAPRKGEILGYFNEPSGNALYLISCGGKTSYAAAGSNGGTINTSSYVTGTSNYIIGSSVCAGIENWHDGIPEPADLIIKDSAGDFVYYFEIDNMTFKELFDELKNYGINCTMVDGQISVEYTSDYYVTGEVWEALGFEEIITTTTTTTTTPIQITSTAAVTYTATTTVTGSETLGSIKNYGTVFGTLTSTSITGTIIKVSTAQDLVNLASAVNSGASTTGKTFILTGDINMSSITDFAGIGNYTYRFQGTFDGQGYTISNLKMSETITVPGTEGYAGLFTYAENATFKNLTISGAVINLQNNYASPATSSGRVGTLVAYGHRCTFDGISIKNTNISIGGGNTSAGGLAGMIDKYNTITNCSTTGTISGVGSEVGGLVGWLGVGSVNTVIDNCNNSIKVTGYAHTGGIIGYISTGSTSAVTNITNCLNKGNVTSTTSFASGIIGRVNTGSGNFSLNISDSINLGSISTVYNSNRANIVGNITNGGGIPSGTQEITINNCFAGQPPATNTDQIYRSDSYYSAIVDTTGSEMGLTWDSICQKAITAGYDTTKWSLDTSNISLKTGDEYDIWLCNGNGVVIQTLDCNASTILNSIYNTLRSHGTANIADGQLIFVPNADVTIDGGGQKFLNTKLTKTVTQTMNSDTTFRELGLTSSTSNWRTTIKNTTTEARQVISIISETTVGDYMNMLSAFGFNCIIKQGKLVINSTNNEFYILGGTSSLETGLKIDFDENKSYTITTSTTTTYTSSTESDRLVDDLRNYIDSDTTFGDLGCPEGSSSTMTVYSNGENHTISVTSSKTLGEFMTELASYGITTEISEDGKFTFKADNNEYVVSMDTDLQNYLKLNDGFTTLQESTIYANTTLNFTLQTETTKTLNSSTTFNDLGVTGAKELEVVSNGSAHTVTVNPDQTLGDLMTTLAGYGIVSSINDGKLIIQGNGENFVSSIDTDLSNILQIEEIVYPDIITTTFTNTTSDEFKSTEQRTLSSSTTIGSLHEGETWYSQYIYLTRPDGIQTRFEVYDSDTIDDIITQLAGYGIRCDIYNGYFSINNEASNSYIIDMNPELKDALGLSNTFYTATVTTTTTNDNSNKLSATTTTTATGATQLIDLRDEHGNAPTDYQINISTESQEGSFNTVLTFNTTDTLHDVIDKLAEYGINATIDSAGRFDISSNTLTDFEISGGLGEFLMSDSYIKKYQESSVSNTSTILPAQTEEFMNDSTILGELGIYSGDVVVYKNGEKFTISVSTPQSVGNFRAQLGEYGISSSIIEGKLQLIANGVVYLETPDSNASNLVEVMGLGQDKWTKGDYSQKSDDLSVVNTINATATLDSKIKDLTDENGNPLGITNGQIYVYQDGVRNIIDINTNDTLRTLANKLKNYGITVGMSQDGHLYFDGNNNSYLTTEGLTSDVASNILTKFNISGEWNTRYDSVSEKLDYEIEGESVADGSTKLVDLQDEDGNSLGITTGTYYVYQNGVRNTETITSDTTVNDFRATMASYGLTTDFNENGELSVGGYNETYLATSALAGDNTNAIDVLFEQWNFVNVYTSNGLDVPENVTVGISETTKLADINEGTYQAGYITVVKDGVKTNIELTENDTVGDLIDELALYGFESVINSNGQLIIKNTGNSTLENYSVEAQRSNALELLGIGVSNWINTNTYEGSPLSVTETTTKTVSATRETLLSDLNLGITTGEYYIYNNGVKYTALISSDETIGSLMDTLASFGIQANLVNNGTNSVISIIGNGDSYVAKSNSTTNASNIVEKLFVAGNDNTNYSYVSEAKKHNELVTSNVAATEFVLLSEFDNIADPTNQKKAQGDLIINIGGTDNTIQITATETIGSLITKLQDLGLNATLSDGTIIISSNFDTITINSASTSKLLETINLQYQTDLGGYVSSNATVIDTQTIIEDKTLSVANYANDGTEMKLLNISSGSLTVYRNGEKATIQIDENQTFGDLNSLISARFSDVKLGFEDGYLRIYSDSDDVSVEVGSTTDTSNFSAITGIASDGNGDTKSSRELYCVNSNSVITTSGLFRNGDVTEGTFKIGDATFEITNTTRLSDLISQINASQDANATAYWDSIDGKFVIQSRTTGAALINIEADSSNFTDIMGLTTSGMEDTDGDGTDDKFITRINTETQKIGDNAKFSINGTYYTSTKNDIGSDVSRINGLTINLKGISEGETTITVERDKETVANAVSDVVDAYNELIENIDKEIAKGKPLADQSTLKLIRNQIRSVMTGALVGASTFKNLDAIGISIEKAAANNINTANINVLNFDKDKFIKAFDADRDALKTLLVGTESNNGIFQQVENIIEQAVTTGYFTSAERSYNNQISRLDDKIEKAQKAVERYKEQLEAKFASMDLLISKMQNQYSSFLGL